tara:strand:- start:285 stop:1043 length:759 start_codon:yes stop_codon:yes gene_type:complete
MRKFEDNLKIIDTKFGKIVVNINDQYIGKAFLNQNYWGLDDISAISKIIELKCKNKNKIIFYDVGANIGSHSVALSNIFKNRIFIRAFEAQSNIYQMLDKTIKINKINNIELYNKAVSDKNDEVLRIELPDYSKFNNFGGLELQKPFKNSDNFSMKMSGLYEDVKTIKLDNFDEEVDFIKMDIEGMENLVINGSKNLITKFRPYLFIELLKTNGEDIINFFKENDYKIYLKGLEAFILPNESKVSFSGLKKL